jgi:hypothetical protein
MEAGIREKVAALAARFAEEVIGVISASIAAQLSSAAGGAPRGRGDRGRSLDAGRPGRVRRSASQLGAISDRIVAELSRRPDGVRAEELRAALGLPRSAMARPIAQLLAAKRIRKTGEKRRTTYFVGGGGSAAKKGNGAPSKRRGGGKAKKAEAQPATPST